MKKYFFYILIFAFSLIEGRGQICFPSAPSPTYSVGSGPYASVCEDFDGDGNLDIATANIVSNNISIILGVGLGGFGTATNFSANIDPRTIVAADLNNDGIKDLIASGTYTANSSVVTVLLGSGTGSFSTPTNYVTSVYGALNSIVAGDFNSDTFQDIIVTNTYDSTVILLLGNGNGTLGPISSFNIGYEPSSNKEGDFNADGNLDILVANGMSDTISFLQGNGSGSFNFFNSFQVASFPTYICTGDLNNDGMLDVVSVSQDTVSVVLAIGVGVFGPPALFPNSAFGTTASIADFNLDGKKDIALGSASQMISIALGNGDGTFGILKSYSAIGSNSIIAKDINSDNYPDIIGSGGYEEVSVLLGDGAGAFNAPLSFPGTGAQPSSITTSDFNNDGFNDLAVAGYVGRKFFVLFGNGAGMFGLPTTYTIGTSNTNLTGIISEDFNLDGNKDIAVSLRGSDNVKIMLGVGGGSFVLADSFSVGNYPNALVSSDFNKDGNPDIATSNRNSNSVSVLLGQGNGVFSPSVSFPVGKDPYSLTTGDFNNDGNTDIVSVNAQSGTVSLLLGTGTGSFMPQDSVQVGGTGITANDFNGDGKLDFATSSLFNMSVLLGHGNGTFDTLVNYPGCGGWNVVSADFNQDGKVDLVALGSVPRSIGVFAGTGTGTFLTHQNFFVPDPYTMVCADFNSDLKSDIATIPTLMPIVSVLLNCTPSPTCVASVTDSLFNISPLNWGLIPNYSPQVTNATWYWGDGTSSSGLYPSHTYTAAGWYSICVTVFTSCGDSASKCRNDTIYRMAGSSSMVNVNVMQNPISVNETNLSEGAILAYPNPASDRITVSSNVEVPYLTVLNLFGEKLLKVKKVGRETALDLSQLPSGIYIIEAGDERLRVIKE